jgi:hypothetical protein
LQRARPSRIDETHLEAALLQLTRDPTPTGRRLDRDRLQLARHRISQSPSSSRDGQKRLSVTSPVSESSTTA